VTGGGGSHSLTPPHQDSMQHPSEQANEGIGSDLPSPPPKFSQPPPLQPEVSKPGMISMTEDSEEETAV
jgi:hypothetical protein